MGQNLRIAVFHNVRSGGAKRAIYEFAKGLAGRGHSIVEIAPSTAEVGSSPLRELASTKIFEMTWPTWRRRVPFVTPYLLLATNLMAAARYHHLSTGMARWIQDQSFDVLMANDCSMLLNPPVAGYCSVPTMLYIHHGSHLSCEATDEYVPSSSFVERVKNVYYSPTAWLWNTFLYSSERWVARHADAVVCNSNLARQLVRDAYGTDSQVVHVGVDGLLFSPSEQKEQGDYVLSAGHLTRHKGFGFLIKSLATLPLSTRPRLVIASISGQQGEKERLLDLAAQCNVSLSIVSPQSEQELIQVYRHAQAFVFAAHREAFGMVVLEAMACGLPVVGVDDGGYADCIVPDVTGFVTERSADSFGQALARLLENPARRQEMGQQSRCHILDSWTWERAVNQLEGELYKLAHRGS